MFGFPPRSAALIAAAAVGVTWQGALPLHGQEIAEPPPGGQPSAQVQNQGQADQDMEVLARGPLHEAFAAPYEADPQEGLSVQQQPPEPIDELPPETKPTGDNVQWIPGYWAWEPDREDFIWISGVWRNVPPNQRWVPGYWTQQPGGFQWVSGFWTGADVQQISYLPPPPESLEEGPTVAAPGDEYFWVPGNWVYHDVDYRWRPGYWARGYDDWIWSPECYTWTPRGYIYTAGYWDYRLPRRGFAFAPVHFYNRARFGPGFYYTPRYNVSLADALLHLFVWPRYSHYYYGNYYDNYNRWGFRPWYSVSYGRNYFYDPMLAFYDSYYHRHGFDFSARLGRWHDYYRNNRDFRPPITLRDSRDFRRRFQDDPNVRHSLLVRDFDEFVRSDREERGFDFNVERLSQDRRRNLQEVSRDFREVVRQRQDVERRDRDGRADRGEPGRGDRDRGELRLPFNRSVVSRRPDFDEGRDRQQRPGDQRGPDGRRRPGDQRGPDDRRGPDDQRTRPGQDDRPQQRPEQRDRPDQRGPDQRDRGPFDRPDQRGERPDQRGQRPDQPGERGERPDQQQRPDQRGERPDQRGERPGQPGQQPDRRGTDRPQQQPRQTDRPQQRGPAQQDRAVPDRRQAPGQDGRSQPQQRFDRLPDGQPGVFRPRRPQAQPRGETPQRRQPGQVQGRQFPPGDGVRVPELRGRQQPQGQPGARGGRPGPQAPQVEGRRTGGGAAPQRGAPQRRQESEGRSRGNRGDD